MSDLFLFFVCLWSTKCRQWSNFYLRINKYRKNREDFWCYASNQQVDYMFQFHCILILLYLGCSHLTQSFSYFPSNGVGERERETEQFTYRRWWQQCNESSFKKHYVFFMFLFSGNEGMFNGKIRLKCLYTTNNDKHPFFTRQIFSQILLKITFTYSNFNRHTTRRYTPCLYYGLPLCTYTKQIYTRL